MQEKPEDEERIRQKLAYYSEVVANSADLALLGKYRRVFKREISLFRRSWVAACLLMHLDKKEARPAGALAREKAAGEKPHEKIRRRNEKKESEAGNVLAEEESKRLFINIGRNRHLYPKEITALINTKAQVPMEDIGAIRILDNYSFVQVRDACAQGVIDALNGTQFKGRTLAVNYARNKSEEAPLRQEAV